MLFRWRGPLRLHAYMRFRTKILVALAVAGVLPVLLLGALSYRANRQELTAAVRAAQLRGAEEQAGLAEEVALGALRDLERAARYLPLAQLSAAEIGTALQIPARQLPDLTVLALLDEGGDSVAPPVVRSAEDGAEEALAAFAGRLPLRAALASGKAVGHPYATARGPRVAVAVGVGGDTPRVLAAEISLASVRGRLAAEALDGDAGALLDAEGRFVMADTDGGPGEALARASADDAGTVRLAGEDWLVARARGPELGWTAVLARPGAAAFGPARRVGLYTFFWAAVALGLSLGLGLLLGRGLARPVADLTEAARALTAGRYDRAAEEGGGDELGELARGFNHMAREVRRRDEEIRRWNAELEARVERQTAELRAAQEQAARSRRLAAVGSLGAGVAHRINNPLAAAVGLVALARMEAGAESEVGRHLSEALGETRRVAAVVEELRALAEREVAEAGRPFSLADAVEAALAPRRDRARAQGIAVDLAVASGLLDALGDPGRVEVAVGHLLDNALEAMPGGGRLAIRLAPVDGEALSLRVSDTGPGVRPEDRDRIFDPLFGTKGRAGVGLTACHRIVEEHHGKIQLDRDAGPGAHFTVILPAAPAPAHLA